MTIVNINKTENYWYSKIISDPNRVDFETEQILFIVAESEMYMWAVVC